MFIVIIVCITTDPLAEKDNSESALAVSFVRLAYRCPQFSFIVIVRRFSKLCSARLCQGFRGDM